MLRIREALDLMLPSFGPVGLERVTLHDALDRVVGRNVPARSDLPPFDNSAMDGYAVHSRDLQADQRLVIRGESRAGGPSPGPLEPGSAMRIFTGAVMPDGADAVVLQENAEVQEGALRVRSPGEPEMNVRRRGSDLAAGEVMLSAGTRIGPGEIGLLAAQRIGAIDVFRRPVVAILSNGDELRDVTDPEESGTIVNSNAYALAAQVREAGGLPWVLPNVADDLDAIVSAIREGLRADLLLTCGGVSVGSYDFTKEAFARNAIEGNFWKVRIKPGKPLTFGLCSQTPVVGLPGNPVSAMVTFEVFVRPALRRMLGDAKPFRALHHVTLSHDHSHSTGRPELARATVLRNEAGGWDATMLRLQGSGSLPSMVGVDALVLLDADTRDFPTGTRLHAILFADTIGADVPPFDA
ncbi:MAG: gephyrin-like molybdotransferase Glp [Myxococcota bacterium]